MKPLTNSEIDSLLDKPNRALNNVKKLEGMRRYVNNASFDWNNLLSNAVAKRAQKVLNLYLSTPDIVRSMREIEELFL